MEVILKPRFRAEVDAVLAYAREMLVAHDRRIAEGVGFYGNRGWADRRTLHAYLRCGYRLIQRKMSPTLELANVVVAGSCQNSGICTALLDGLEELAAEFGRVFVVENILNEYLLKHVLQTREGYEAVSTAQYNCTYYRDFRDASK